MSNYAWLCDYTNCSVNTYGIVVQTDDYDAVSYTHLTLPTIYSV